ncbi:craniofacial development protein 2 [Biomphalaria glabrata]|nr:craniofacial development protein 2 [Biomphalaria glabrata]
MHCLSVWMYLDAMMQSKIRELQKNNWWLELSVNMQRQVDTGDTRSLSRFAVPMAKLPDYSTAKIIRWFYTFYQQGGHTKSLDRTLQYAVW